MTNFFKRCVSNDSLNIQISVIKSDFDILHTRVRSRDVSAFLRRLRVSWMRRTKNASVWCFMNETFFLSLQTKQKISREATRANRRRNSQQIFHICGVGVFGYFFSGTASWRSTKSVSEIINISIGWTMDDTFNWSLANVLEKKAKRYSDWLTGIGNPLKLFSHRKLIWKCHQIYRWGALMHIVAILLPTRRWHLAGNFTLLIIYWCDFGMVYGSYYESSSLVFIGFWTLFYGGEWKWWKQIRFGMENWNRWKIIWWPETDQLCGWFIFMCAHVCLNTFFSAVRRFVVAFVRRFGI